MKSWKTLSKRTLLKRPPFLNVEEHTIRLPDGREIDDWTWVDTPDYACIAVFTEEKQLFCFRQTKYAVSGVTLAPPGGYLEPDETPIEGAKRELLEETGLAAEQWIALGGYPVDSNRGAGTAHFFIAFEAHHVAQPTEDDLEETEPVLLSLDEARLALEREGFGTLPWAACISLAINWIDLHKPF